MKNLLNGFVFMAVSVASVVALAQRPFPGGGGNNGGGNGGFNGGSNGGGGLNGGGNGNGGFIPAQCPDNRSIVSDARASLQEAAQSLRDADSALAGSFEAVYRQAIEMVCVGHCSPGITDALNRMHAAVDQARAQIRDTASSASRIDADLSLIR